MDLIETVRETRTLDGGIAVYANAEIGLMKIDPCTVYPTALYVLSEKLSNIYNLANRMARKGIDIFDLDCVYEDDEIIIAPPVCEESDGVWGIIDGIHRMSVARKENISVNTILVRGSSLPIAFKPVNWEDVVEYQQKPDEGHLLRVIRDGIQDTSHDLRRHFRDFGYLGSKGRRPVSWQHA